jgi:hypothetical protein
MQQRMLGLIYRITRVAMRAGLDLPEDAVTAFDAADGLATLLRMLASAHAAGDILGRGRVMGAIAGVRMHKPSRWAALRAAGGPGSLLEPLLVIARQPDSAFLPTAVIALARALVGLQRVWTDSDSEALDVAVDRALLKLAASHSGPFVVLRSKIALLLTVPRDDNRWERICI